MLPILGLAFGIAGELDLSRLFVTRERRPQ
jgi:hypothetical protein